MSRKKLARRLIDIRGILESPVGQVSGGPPICAYEAAMRRAADKGASGNMREAGRFIRALIAYGLLEPPQFVDDHHYVLRIPKDWDHDEWHAMRERYGPPPWPGEHDGLIPIERWKPIYGPRPAGTSRSRKK